MKTFKTTILILAVASAAFAGGVEGWLDLENCGMCKNLMNDAELFDAMTWETHVLSNGLLEVTTYPADMKDRFGKLMGSMAASGDRMMAGEKMEMCGMCESYGAMMMKGVAMDQIETEAGMITVITSQDPAVVAMIQKHGQTTIDAYAEMMAAGEHQEHGEHPKGHDHPKSSDHPD